MNELEYLREYVRLDSEIRLAEKELPQTDKSSREIFVSTSKSLVLSYLRSEGVDCEYLTNPPACSKEDKESVTNLCQKKATLLYELGQKTEILVDKYMLLFRDIDQQLGGYNQRLIKKRKRALKEAQLKIKKAKQALLVHRVLYMLPDELVTQHRLDKLDWFDCYTEIEPDKAGIYFLFDKLSSGLDYIGHSHKIRSRLISGHPVYKKDKYFIGVLYESDDTTRTNLEARLIASFAPPFNQRKG